MSRNQRFVFTGGGTGGHVTPNLAIIRELRQREPEAEILYLGTARGAEHEMVGKAEIPFLSLSAHPFVSPRRLYAFARFSLALCLGVLRALVTLWRFRPDVVVASGGYVSVPTVLAAAILRRPIYLHEQNVHPGKANLLLSRFATKIGVSFRESLDFFPESKAIHAGYPVRARFGNASRQEHRERLGIPNHHRVAFFVGGSMGSRSINRATIDGLNRLLEDENITVIHSTGLAERGAYDAWNDTRLRLEKTSLSPQRRERYLPRRFFDEIEAAYGASDLIVTRAGAGAIMELATLGKPILLIPKSDGADAHQLANAITLKDQGRADVMLEESYDEGRAAITRVHGDQLARRVRELLEDSARRESMSEALRELVVPNALAANTDAVLALASPPPAPTSKSQQQLVGLIRDATGIETELLFNVSTLGHGSGSDIVLKDRGQRERALIRRVGVGRENTEYLLIPRRGQISVDGIKVESKTKLSPGQVLSIGPNRLTFDAKIRTLEIPHQRGSVLSRVIATGLGTLLSRCFGLVRTLVLGLTFATTGVMDIFAASLTISNLFRRIFAENAIDSAFLPSFMMLRRNGRPEEAQRLLRTVFTTVVGASAVVAALAMLTVHWWLPWVLPGFVAKGLIGDAITLTRLMLPYLVLVTVAAIFSAVCRAHNRFGLPAYASLMYSIGVIVGILLYPRLGIMGLGVGVLLGGLGQAALHLPVILGKEFRRGFKVDFRPLFAWGETGAKKVRGAAPKILGDVTISKVGSVVDIMIVSTLAVGDPSTLFFALVLFQLPFALVSQSINTVALKEFSESQAARDLDYCRRLVTSGINWNVFLLIPISALMVVLSVPTVELVLEYGNFDVSDTQKVAAALCAYSIGLIGWGLQGLTGRFYAARLEVGQAMLINLGAVALNIVLSLYFAFGLNLSFVGVALGTSISFLANGLFRIWHLNRNLTRDGGGFQAKDLLPSLQATMLGTLAAAPVAWFTYEVTRDFDLLPTVLSRLVVFSIPAGLGALVFLGVAFVAKSPEVDEVLARVSRFLPRQRRGAPARSMPLNVYCLKPFHLLSVALHRPAAVKGANLTRRVKSFLGNSDWRVRNVGVKLAGMLKIQALRYELCDIVKNRRPAPLWPRIWGADFEQPGFVRRNAVVALRTLEAIDPDVEDALLTALDDPYYEVRSTAAHALRTYATVLTPPARERANARLRVRVRERNFEVAVAAVLAYGATALDESILLDLEKLHYHRNWQVRSAVVKVYHELWKRGVVEDWQLLLSKLDDVLITCDSFNPTFALKEAIFTARNGLQDAGSEDSGPLAATGPAPQES
ncbi:MAG: murein biosynthesis integral membrane protein MurJ [Planctomycetota bacterium]